MKLKHLFSFIVLVILCLCTSTAWTQQQPIFPNLEGSELLEKVVESFKPETVLEYGPARDLMYGDIYNVNDTVYGIYTGHALYLPPDVDPSFFLYMNGSDDGINCEHTYPRSKGAAEGNGHSDMHHLFPSRLGVNAARDHFPFAEINDSQTTNWYFKTTELNHTPSSNIDLYSERIQGRFEPREDQKGNIARAMFYFYSMYNDEAMAADPTYFEGQRETLCQWHYLDPADALEWERTNTIATYQDDKPNPFILDCTLASRAYCEGISGDCPDFPLSTSSTGSASKNTLRVFPNPTISTVNVSIVLETPSSIQLSLYDKLGRRITTTEFENLPDGEHQFPITSDTPGMIICELIISNSQGVESLRKKVMVNRK